MLQYFTHFHCLSHSRYWNGNFTYLALYTDIYVELILFVGWLLNTNKKLPQDSNLRACPTFGIVAHFAVNFSRHTTGVINTVRPSKLITLIAGVCVQHSSTPYYHYLRITMIISTSTCFIFIARRIAQRGQPSLKCMSVRLSVTSPICYSLVMCQNGRKVSLICQGPSFKFLHGVSKLCQNSNGITPTGTSNKVGVG